MDPARVAAVRTTTGTAEAVLASFALFTLFAGDFWRNLISWPGYFVLVGLLTADGVRRLAVRRLGGINGDVLGALVETTTLATLLVMAANLP